MKRYLRPYEVIGDYVKCCNCEAIMLVSIGTEICPECGMAGCLAWMDEQQEHTIDDFD